MIHYWDQSERFQGILFYGEEELGESRFVFHWNPFLTNDMKVEIFDAPESINITNVRKFQEKKLTIECKYGEKLRYKFTLNPDLGSGSLRAREQVIEVPVNEYVSSENFENSDEHYSLFCRLDFPLASITDDEFWSIKHSDYGLFHANYNPKDETFDLKKEELNLNTEIGVITLSHNYRFLDSKKTSSHVKYFPTKLLVMHSKLIWEKQINKLEDIQNSINAFEKKCGEILDLISMAERNRVDWYHAAYDVGTGTENQPVSISNKYKYMGIPTDRIRNSNLHFKTIQSFLEKVLNIYEGLSSHKKNEVRKLVKNFKIAHLGKTFEDSFVRWHSCLDFLRQKFGNGGRNPSQQILRSFEENDIPLNDLISEEEIDEVRKNSNAKFTFTDLRDKYIHSGFDAFVDKYDLGMNQQRIMRAMAERLLLYRMGIDYRDTHLGMDDV